MSNILFVSIIILLLPALVIIILTKLFSIEQEKIRREIKNQHCDCDDCKNFDAIREYCLFFEKYKEDVTIKIGCPQYIHVDKLKEL